MNVYTDILFAAIAMPCQVTFEPDVTKYPGDKAVLPAQLENMRPGQIRDAVAQGTPCLVPVGTLENDSDEVPLGIDREGGEYRLLSLAQEMNAVVAPTLWYSPTGYILSGPDEGTFDLPAEAFAAYIEEVLLTLRAVGFKTVQIVPLHNPQGDNSPLIAACRFALGNIFNNLWKNPEFGQNWWIRPDRDKLNWGAFGMRQLPTVSATNPGQPATDGLCLPLRLENMRPAELKGALQKGLPCFVPTGVLENHGNHNPIGCDAFEVQNPILEAASRAPAVIAPTIWFGPTAYAVTGPKLATTDINGVVFQRFADGVVSGLAAMGFKHIIFLHVHQGGGAEGTGIDLAIQQYRSRLASQVGYGPGWARHLTPQEMQHPQIERIGTPGGKYDHAGKNETSWMLYLRRQYTDLSLIRPGDYPFCWEKGNEANTATAEWGRQMNEEVVANLVRLIQEKTSP